MNETPQTQASLVDLPKRRSPSRALRVDTCFPIQAQAYLKWRGLGRLNAGVILLLDTYEPEWRTWRGAIVAKTANPPAGRRGRPNGAKRVRT